MAFIFNLAKKKFEKLLISILSNFIKIVNIQFVHFYYILFYLIDKIVCKNNI